MSGSYIFISYSHKDEPYVRDLARRLADLGLDPWFFTASQTAGVSWPQRLLDAIRQARAVLVVISSASNSPAAEYVLAEVMLAQRERRFIIPLKIHASSGPLDIILAARNWINVWDGSDPLPQILAAVASQTGTLSQVYGDDFAALKVDPSVQTHVNTSAFQLSFPPSMALAVQGAPVVLCRLGRDPRGDLIFAGALNFISRQHAQIYAQSSPDGLVFILADQHSRHGTFVNGARITSPHTLLDGDQIGLGAPRFLLTFERIAVTGEPPGAWAEGSP